MSIPVLRKRLKRRQRGSALIFSAVALPTVLALLALAVDLGRVQLVKTELQNATDAAAGAAIIEFANGIAAAESAAITVAGQNNADGSPIVILASDVEFGTWNSSSRTFTALSGSSRSTADAIRVTARRTAARAKPVHLYFASSIGINDQDVTVSAIARKKLAPTGLIALTKFQIVTSARVDSYDSSSGDYSYSSTTWDGWSSGGWSSGGWGGSYGSGYGTTWSTSGTSTSSNDGSGDVTIYSNATMDLNNTAYVQGNVRYKSGPYTKDSGVTITGSVSTYSTAFSFPVKSAGTASTTNNNSQLTSYFNGSDLVIPDNQSASFAGGTYYLHKIDVGKNSTLRFTGPTIIYLYADTTIDGDLGCTTGKPEHLQIYMTVAHWIHIREKAHVYAVIYNPTDDIQIEDDAQLFGSGIANNFIIKDRARGHYDTALGTGDGSTASSVCIVK